MGLATDRGQTPAGTLVLDFDGTVCLGDDPVRLYCQEGLAGSRRIEGSRSAVRWSGSWPDTGSTA